jgi:hypothetical protein
MGEFILWVLVTLLFTGGVTVCGYKTKEAWDKWHHVKTAVQTTIGQNIAGDLVEGNKTVIDKYINVTGAGSLSEKSATVGVAKLKIGRAFEDFNKNITDIARGFPKESEAIANQFNARGTIASGMHLKAQMDLSINTKRKLDEEIDGLKRKIEDILIETLNKTSLDSAGAEFDVEQKRLEEAKKQCVAIYPLLNDTPKSWEQKTMNEVRLTKDFDVLKGQKY